jgi:hypothetical protein
MTMPSGPLAGVDLKTEGGRRVRRRLSAGVRQS